MAYRDPVTKRFAKQGETVELPPMDRGHGGRFVARQAAPKESPPQMVHGLEWDDEPDADLPGGPSALQIYLFAMAVVVVIVGVAVLVNRS